MAVNYKKALIIILLLSAGAGVLVYFNLKIPVGAGGKSQASPSLSAEKYEAVKKDFLKLEDEKDPRVTLTELQKRIKNDNVLLRSCHALTHEIGRRAYTKYRDFGEAMKYQDEICNSGYLHGVIEAYFSKSRDVFKAVATVCAPYPSGKFLSWECYHGVGHGLMYYTSNDLPASLKMCDSYEDYSNRSSCANGVFMENFNTDQKLHPSKFLRQDDLFYPCNDEATQYKADCYLYAPVYYLSLNKNDYAGALKWCEGAGSPYISICVQGVGGQAIKENFNNPKFVERICMSGSLKNSGLCIEGMVGLYINHYGSLEPAKALCGQLELPNRPACYFSVQARADLF